MNVKFTIGKPTFELAIYKLRYTSLYKLSKPRHEDDESLFSARRMTKSATVGWLLKPYDWPYIPLYKTNRPGQ